MIFNYTNNDWKNLKRAEAYRFLQCNGLGGYMALTAAFSVTRCDDGILCSSVQCPNVRKLLVHRLKETLQMQGKETIFSMQRFRDGREEGSGLDYLETFQVDDLPEWTYQIGKVSVKRSCAVLYGQNASVLTYEIENLSPDSVEWIADPGFLMNYKGEPVKESGRIFTCEIRGQRVVGQENRGNAFMDQQGDSENTASEDTASEDTSVSYSHAVFSMDGFDQQVRILTDGAVRRTEPSEELLAYPDDEKDGRPGQGYEAHACEIRWTIPAGSRKTVSLLFSLEQGQEPEGLIPILLKKEKARRKLLQDRSKYSDETARELVRAADCFLSHKESTGGSTLIAGYPLFGDWGRDTMISLPGCILATGKYKEAREIFRTFLKYERRGLIPNLFPEKGQDPMYNSVDAPLLLIEGLKLYADRTSDWEFIRENMEVLQRIVRAYKEGTDYHIHMDADYLITQGESLWQLTWMDACIDGILPTPRYGKPVEINAYWYNALRIMAEFSERFGDSRSQEEYLRLAGHVRESFIRKFWMPEKGYLKDLVSGEKVDEQIRCNQIWALTMTYTMLSKEQERQILQTVREKLYTPYGLRTLSPDDPEYKGWYGGPQFDRDMAYHQGTIWVYPLGAWYRAVLKNADYSAEAVAGVKEGLKRIPAMLREGCAGSLPEIYDGDTPGQSKGCYAQCWSVGEILRVYEELEKKI